MSRLHHGSIPRAHQIQTDAARAQAQEQYDKSWRDLELLEHSCAGFLRHCPIKVEEIADRSVIQRWLNQRKKSSEQAEYDRPDDWVFVPH